MNQHANSVHTYGPKSCSWVSIVVLLVAVFVCGSAHGAVDCDTVSPPPYQLDSIETFSFGTSGGSDCWGWTGPDGTEYAIMGVASGLVFVNANALEVVDSVDGPTQFCGSTRWRDVSTFRNYCYAVSECGGADAGLMTIDLQYLPDSVHRLGVSTEGGATSHNLSVDTVAGYLYTCANDGSGFRVYSLANPSAPALVNTVSTGDIHDMFARNDTVYVSEGGLSTFSIWNMADKLNPELVVRVGIPPASGYSHNIWPSDDGRYVITTEETGGHTIKVWDVSDPQNVALLSEFLAPSNLAHNVHVDGPHIITSHYQSGVQVVDMAVPECPKEVARFDTFSGESPGFAGCWGVYPFTSNGLMYGSNMDGRLFILSTTDTVVFTNFSSNSTVGQAPLTVQFFDQSKSLPVGRQWDFGDGAGTTDVQNPTHEYAGGLYTVSLDITTSGGYQGRRVRNNYITVLGDDTLTVPDITVPADVQGYWELECNNELPITELILPITMTNVTSVAFFDSVSFIGTRLANFELKQVVFDSRFSGQLAYRLKADNGGGTPPLAAGSGPIARVHYRTRSFATNGQTVALSTAMMGAYSLTAKTLTADFVPGFLDGILTIGDDATCNCSNHGDLIGDGVLDASDLNSLIDRLFFGGSALQDPLCVHVDRGDMNCDGVDDAVDLNFLLEALFFGGTLPCDPCACESYPAICP